MISSVCPASRLKWLLVWTTVFLFLTPLTDANAADADWLLFKQRFMPLEGRIIDNGRDSVSHSEGQESADLAAYVKSQILLVFEPQLGFFVTVNEKFFFEYY